MVTGKLHNSSNKKMCTYIFLLFFRFFLLFVVSNFFVQKLSASAEGIAAGSLEKITTVVNGGKQILSNDYFKFGMRSVSTIITVYGVFSFLAANIKYLKTDPKKFSRNLITYLTNYAYKLVGIKVIMVILKTVINHMKKKKIISEEEGKKLLENVDKVENAVRGSGLISLKSVVDTMRFFSDVQKEYLNFSADGKINSNSIAIEDLKKEGDVKNSKIAVIDRWVDIIIKKPKPLNSKNKGAEKDSEVKKLCNELMGDQGPIDEGLAILYNMAEEAGRDNPIVDGAKMLGENIVKALNAKKIGENVVMGWLKKADIFKLKDKWDQINPKKKLDDALYFIMDKVEAIILKSLTGEDLDRFKKEMKDSEVISKSEIHDKSSNVDVKSELKEHELTIKDAKN